VSSIKFFLAVLVVSMPLLANVHGTTLKYFHRRSDSRHRPRQLVGLPEQIHHTQANPWRATIDAMPIYSHSFAPNKIAQCLFGDSFRKDPLCNRYVIPIQGSKIYGRDKTSWFADYFYLPATYDGFITFNPTIKNFCCNFDLLLELDRIAKGLYVRVLMPFVHTNWDLNLCEEMKPSSDPRGYEPGYFSQDNYPTREMVPLFSYYAKGDTPAPSPLAANNIIWHPLCYARMCQCARKRTGLAEIRADLGLNLLDCTDRHIGVYLQAAAPTGNAAHASYLFDAAIGNGNHWEVGAGISAHWQHKIDEYSSLGFHFDACITHLFERTQCRTFELQCKPNSAYMLAAKFANNLPSDEDAADATDGQVGSGLNNIAPGLPNDPAIQATAVSKQFDGEYSPVANLSTINVRVSVPAQADIVAMVRYTCKETTWDFGYNFWGRSCERINDSKTCTPGSLYDPTLKDTWALKGDARMFGFQGISPDGTNPPDFYMAVSLSATQSKATICGGTNDITAEQIGIPNVDYNPNVDNPGYAYIVSPLDGNDQVGPLSFLLRDSEGNLENVFDYDGSTDDDYLLLTSADWQVQTSNEPVFLSSDDIEISRIRGISHTIFAHVSRTYGTDEFAPFAGLGGSVEFGKTSRSACCNAQCETECCPVTDRCSPCQSGVCLDCAISQWNIWTKFGVTFG